MRLERGVSGCECELRNEFTKGWFHVVDKKGPARRPYEYVNLLLGGTGAI